MSELPDPISLAAALADPAAARHVRVDDGEDPTALFDGEFPALRRLYLRCGLPESPRRLPPSLTEVEVVLRSADDFDRLVDGFEQVEVLEVWGRHLKRGVLPDAIGRMQRLRELTLVSCGLRDLPDALAELPVLGSVAIRGCPIVGFPLVLTRIRTLARLDLRAGLEVSQMVGLPDEVAAMQSLRELSLQGCFNKGLAGSDAEHVRPLPNVLGTLAGLEVLDVSQCGVDDHLEALHPLGRLRKLDVGWGPIRDLSALAPLQSLEELGLRCCYKARDLAPLAALPRLRVLDLSSNHYLSDVSGIAGCLALEELDISDVGDLDTLRPLLDHPTLRVLKASDAVLAKWAQRERLRGMPDKDELLRGLASDDRAEVERALAIVAEVCQLESSGEGSAVFSWFGVDEDDGLVEVPLLDGALSRFGAELPADIVLDLVRMSLVSVTQNLKVVLDAVEILVDRRDAERQEAVARQFHAASQYYDSGHRSWDDTVLDHLIDDLFPRFLPGPLATLLEGVANDALSSHTGDAMDGLFVAALAQRDVLDDTVRDRLVDGLAKYCERMIEYEHADLVERLLDALTEVNPDAAATVRARLGGAQVLARLQEEVDGAKTLDDVLRLLARIADPAEPLTFAQADEVSAFSGRILAHGRALPADAAEQVLRGAWTQGQNWDYARLFADRLAEDPVATRALLDRWLADHPDDRDTTLRRLRLAKQVWLRDVGDDAVAAALRAIEAEITGGDPSELLAAELSELLLGFAKGNGDADWQAAVATLHRIGAQDRPVARTWEHFSYLQMKYEQLVQGVQFDPEEHAPKVVHFLRGFVASLPRVDWGNAAIETIAADGVAAAQLSGDPTIERLVFDHLIPDPVGKDRLAFNLACFFGARGDRDGVVRWAARALALGKPPSQLRDDGDLAAYQDDPEFQALLAQAER